MTLVKIRLMLVGLLTSLLIFSGAPADARPKAPAPRSAQNSCDPCEQARRAAARLRACGAAIKKVAANKKPRTKKPKLAKVKAATKKVQAAKGKVRAALKKAKDVSAKKVAAKARAKGGEKLSKSFWDSLNVAEKEAAQGIAVANQDVAHAINELTDCTVDAYKEADIPLVIVEPAANEFTTTAHAPKSEAEEEKFIASVEAEMAAHDNDFADFATLSDEASDDALVGAAVEDLGNDLFDETEVVEIVYIETEEDPAEEAATGDFIDDEADDTDDTHHDVAEPDHSDTDHSDGESGDDSNGGDDDDHEED